jgi:hypothetical protein
MKRVGLTAALAALVVLSTSHGNRVFAQSGTGQEATLRREIERRFDVRLRSNGVLLLPKGDDRRVRMIEVTDDSIALDGAPATGAEVREKLGPDAELVLQLSYLDAAARRRLAEGTVSGAVPEAERSIEPPAESRDQDDRRDRDDRRRDRDERRRERRSQNGEDRVRFGGSISVSEGEVIAGDVVAIGGSVRVDGEVSGNVVAIGGGLELGPHANVIGDAVALGGGLRRDPGARIGGKIVDGGLINFDFGQWRWNRFGRFFPFGVPFFGAAAGLFALMGTIMRVVVLCVLASLVLFVGREYVERVSERAAAEPLKAGAVGVLAQLLFVPLLVLTIVVLVITLVGIPLLALIPFAILALAVVFLIGFTAVAYRVGRLANARFAWRNDNPYVTAATGILLLVSPLLIARLLGLANWLLFPMTGTLVFLGLLIEYLAWTGGFGAVALLRFSRPSGGTQSAPPATA